MASGTYTPDVFLQLSDTNGNPLSGGKVYTYLAGTSTLQATFSDSALSVQNANPIILASDGRPSSGAIFLTPGASYKFVLQDSTGATIATRDNISAVPPASINDDITGTAGEALTAGQCVYLSDGSGSKTAGSWYKADSANTYSSSLPEVGILPSSIASGASGTIRQHGQITGLSSLVVGTTYYIGTAGAVTSTPPTNRRVLGVADTTSSLVFDPIPRGDASATQTDAAGRMQQIAFAATQSASSDVNTLDDYEEGTWTPVLGGSGGTSGQTYTRQVGTYVKIGKLVTAFFTVQFSAKGTITTNCQIQGLPFTIENTANALGSTLISYWDNLAVAKVVLGGLCDVNATTSTLYGLGAAGASMVVLATADIGNATQIVGTITYRATA